MNEHKPLPPLSKWMAVSMLFLGTAFCLIGVVGCVIFLPRRDYSGAAVFLLTFGVLGLWLLATGLGVRALKRWAFHSAVLLLCLAVIALLIGTVQSLREHEYVSSLLNLAIAVALSLATKIFYEQTNTEQAEEKSAALM